MEESSVNQSNANITKSPQADHRMLILAVTGLLVIILLIIAGIKYTLQSKSTQKSDNSSKQSIFSFQTATIYGKVLAVKGNTITLQNSKNNLTQDFELAETVFIGTPTSNKPTTDISKIELNKELIINLRTTDSGKFVVQSIGLKSPTVNQTTKPTPK